MTLWQAHEPEETELGRRAGLALRFSFMNEVWVDTERHHPGACPCFWLPIFFNHAGEDPPCRCSACQIVREVWVSSPKQNGVRLV